MVDGPPSTIVLYPHGSKEFKTWLTRFLQEIVFLSKYSLVTFFRKNEQTDGGSVQDLVVSSGQYTRTQAPPTKTALMVLEQSVFGFF